MEQFILALLFGWLGVCALLTLVVSMARRQYRQQREVEAVSVPLAGDTAPSAPAPHTT